MRGSKGQEQELQHSVLYGRHVELAGRSHMAGFAGYLMPLWYSSISREHFAVRQAVGVFDCTHMGILEFSGKDAKDFLDKITVNDVKALVIGKAQYSYILDAAGAVLDDIIIYKRNDDRFMVVVNAANERKVKAWLESIINEKCCIDSEFPERVIGLKPVITDLRGSEAGQRQRVDIAIQGPESADRLKDIVSGDVSGLEPFSFIETKIVGMDAIVSRTGYTGSKVGFELYVHPENAVEVWDALLDIGAQPCGLGARDSLRIEAGLPLYGHELAGKFDISPYEAGYKWAVKLEKDFFIGKNIMLRKAGAYDMEVARVKLPGEKGVRPVRADDGVVKDGCCIGWVLSCAKVGDFQFALVYVKKDSLNVGSQVGIYYLARNPRQIEQGRKEKVLAGEQLSSDFDGETLARFERF